MKLTVIDAARLARTPPENVREALASGDLRDLSVREVELWIRGRNARAVVNAVRPA